MGTSHWLISFGILDIDGRWERPCGLTPLDTNTLICIIYNFLMYSIYCRDLCLIIGDYFCIIYWRLMRRINEKIHNFLNSIMVSRDNPTNPSRKSYFSQKLSVLLSHLVGTTHPALIPHPLVPVISTVDNPEYVYLGLNPTSLTRQLTPQ